MSKIKILKSQKGMTLVELVVAITIMAILIPVISSCILYTVRQYAQAKNYADMCGVISAIDGTIERALTLATNPNVIDGAIHFVENGSRARKIETREVTHNGETLSVLFIDNIQIFDTAFYNDVGVKASFTLIPTGGVNVSISYSGVANHLSNFIVSKI